MSSSKTLADLVQFLAARWKLTTSTAATNEDPHVSLYHTYPTCKPRGSLHPPPHPPQTPPLPSLLLSHTAGEAPSERCVQQTEEDGKIPPSKHRLSEDSEDSNESMVPIDAGESVKICSPGTAACGEEEPLPGSVEAHALEQSPKWEGRTTEPSLDTTTAVSQADVACHEGNDEPTGGKALIRGGGTEVLCIQASIDRAESAHAASSGQEGISCGPPLPLSADDSSLTSGALPLPSTRLDANDACSLNELHYKVRG